jgi:hypothetical protein
MIDSIAEFADTSVEVSARAERFEAMLRTAFKSALAQIEAQDGLANTLDQSAAVETLIAASIGLNVMIRAKGECSAGAPLAAGIAAVIRSWER